MATIKNTININNGNDIQTVGTTLADTLDGGIKATPTAFFTELFGGGGNDTYYIDAVSVATMDKVVELPNAGIDSVVLVNTWNGVSGYWNTAANNYTLSDNVENLSVLGNPLNTFGNNPTTPGVAGGTKQVDTVFQGMTIYGNALNNVITTGNGGDKIYGGAGNDTMQGGAGADVYYVDAIGDKVIEGTDPYYLPSSLPNGALGGVGNQADTVFSMVSFTLGSGLENLNLDISSGNTSGTGNALDNRIFGSAGNNVLSSLGGNDFMYGGGGKDTLLGGDGDDYLAGDGYSFQTNYFNHLGLLTAVNTTVYGGDVLDGGNGNDTLAGADGDKLLGGAGNDTLYGNALNAAIHSGAPTPNEKMTMDGGAGNDGFMNFGIKDVIIGGLGIDTVFIDFGAVAVNYTLGADVERGILMSGANTADILTGNAQANYLQGNNSGDYLDGKAGDDVLDGATGTDTMLGGDGNDHYMVDSLSDVVIETNAAISSDTVFSYITSYTLGANVENLVLEQGTYTGGAAGAARNGKGNALDNLIIGNSQTNLLEGGAGKDTLDGGNGSDIMIGGAGDDVYYADRTADIIQELADFTSTAPGGLPTTTVGGIDSVILVNDNTTPGAHFFNGTSYSMTRNLEKLDASAITLAGSLLGVNFSINGNESNNTIIGSRLNDTINGGAGIDSMNGGAGNDTYYVAEADVVSETLAGLAGGIDTIMYRASLPAGFTMGANIENLVILGGSGKITGNALDNTITGNGSDNVIEGGAGKDTLYGNAGNDSLDGGLNDNTIDGGEGNDTMRGGAGNDTYVVDNGDGDGSGIGGDIIIDAGGTNDTVLSNTFAYTLGTGIENLTLLANGFNGTGNGAANKITGNAENNVLDGAGGNDTIDGGLNRDVMIGGAGDDTFYVDNAGDIVREDSAAGGGLKDTVISTISYSLADTDGINNSLGGGVENLTLASTVTGGAAAFNATGNAFNNTIIGNENNNIIDGGTTTVVGGNGGADSMTGGDGNDTYMVDNIGDKITELTSVVLPVTGPQILATVGNADSVYLTLADASSFNMSINALNVERLYILDNIDTLVGGQDSVNVVGNASDNIIWGGLGKNSIDGGDGNDIITGGAGNDTLLGGKGDDVLNGDGLFQNAFNGAWINASGGLDSMNGGDGSDTYYVDVGDGAGTLTVGIAAEDVVADSGVTSLTAKDTVKLVGSTITNYTLDSAIENLDLSGLATVGTVSAMGNVSANAITGMETIGYAEVLSGGDGNDNFVLTPTNGANDTIRGGSDTLFGGAATSDTSKADTIYAKVDTTLGLVTANIDIKQIEAVTLDVSDMVTTANAFTWNFTNFGDASNFTQAPSAAIGNVAPFFTITGGVTLTPDTATTTVTGSIIINGLDITKPVTYVLANYGQNALTTTLDFGTTTAGTTDKLNVVLDNHRFGGLAATGIETLSLVSTGDVMNSGLKNVLDVSAVAGALIDVTGDSSLQLLGLATGRNINLHDYAAQNFDMQAPALNTIINLALNNVETSLISNGNATASLTTLNLAITNSTIGNIGSVINASGLNAATAAFAVSGAGNLTLNNLRGGTLNMTGTGQLDLNAVGGAALNLIASSGVVIANIGGTARADTYNFGTSLNNLDSVTDVGGADTLTAAITGLNAATGQLHIAGVEILNLISGVGNTVIDGQFITGAEDVILTGNGNVTLTHMTLGVPAAGLGLLNASGFTGNLFADFSAMTTNGVEIRDGSGNDTLIGSAYGGPAIPAPTDIFVMYGGGIDFVSAGVGDDTIYFGNFALAAPNTNLTSTDTVDGGAGVDILTYYGGILVGTNAFDNVTNIEEIVFGAATTSITTVDALVAAGASLFVNAANLGALQTLTWNGNLETDGAFSVVGGAGADVITGGAGNDTIAGDAGLDSIVGGGGDDVITMNISAGNIDAIDAGIGNDTLLVNGNPAGAVVIDLSSVADQIVSINAVTDAAIQIGFESFSAANMGGTAALTITAAATGSTIVGGGGADTINGGVGHDTLDGGNGIDSITGGSGNDTILWNKATSDVLDGGIGIDTLKLVTTTTANISVDLSQTGDQVSTTAGIQTGFENLDASVLVSGALTAIAAATGSNIIGGGGNDILTGGAGVDVLTGNAGADRFVFNATPIAGNIDTITDFTVGIDRIELAHTAFDMVTTVISGLNTSEFASGAGLISSTTAGTVLLYNSATGNLYYDADANGSGTGVLIAHLQGLVALTAADINII